MTKPFEVSEINNTLNNRGKLYGDYKGATQLRIDMMQLIKGRHHTIHGCEMKPMMQLMILDIVDKLARIAATPNHIDSWHDIQGYAKLTEDYLIVEEQKHAI